MQRGDAPELDARILAFLARRFAPGALAAVYRFGSTARGTERPESDVDVALLPRAALDPVQVFELAQDLASELRRDVDLVDLARASTVMRAQVVGGGARIDTGDRVAAETFEMYALSDYARLQEERKEAVQAFLERYRG